MAHLVWLNEQRALDARVVGPKAASLARMLAAELPVPAGFCLPAVVLSDLLRAEPLAGLLAALADDACAGMPLARASARLRGAVMATPLPDALRGELLAAAGTLRERSPAGLAVRSSALVEDQPDQSFAGQFQTFLGVQGDDELLAAVRSCWSALFSQRALEYTLERGLPMKDLAMAVVVQALVPARVAGILHTADPPARPDELLVEAAWGLGPSVAEGAIVPDLWRIRRDTGAVASFRAGNKQQMATLDPGGGLAWRPLPRQQAEAPCLDEASLVGLCDLALRVERLFRGPRQVEWALADDTLHLLQARPLPSVKPSPLGPQHPGAPVDWYAAWVARRLAPVLAPPPLPDAADWHLIVAERLAPLADLGLRPPRPEDVLRFQDGVAVALDPRWPPEPHGTQPGATAPAPSYLSPQPAPSGATVGQSVRDGGPASSYLSPQPAPSRIVTSAATGPAGSMSGSGPPPTGAPAPTVAASAPGAGSLALYDLAVRRGLLLPPDLLAPWFESGQFVEGLTVSGERVVGRARVVRQPEDLEAARPGEVLVASYMRPTMTAVLGTIAGLVVEAGGSTSHVATISRELGLPCLMSALAATRRIRTGQLVLLDAPAGRCYFFERPSQPGPSTTSNDRLYDRNLGCEDRL